LARRRAEDPARLGGTVVDQAARDLALRFVATAHGLAALEIPGYLDHADRQQAFALRRQRLDRACVENERAADLKMVGEPLLAGPRRRALGAELGADALAPREPRQHVALVTRGDDGVCTAARRALGGKHLGDHAAPGEMAAGTARHLLQRGIA